MKMNKQGGFTLIELVVVIIILGILAVTAAPKFMNLQSDARSSTLEGLKGALQGANTLVYSKASIAGVERSGAATVDLAGDDDETNDVAVVYGYLAATKEALTAAMELDTESEWTILDAPTGLYIYPKAQVSDTESTDVECRVQYEAATDGVLPTYTVEDSDC